MDAATLAKAMDNRVPMARYEELAPAFNRALIQANCNTVLRVTMFCSQIGHESGGLKWMEEIADGSAYEGRRDLGNTQQGDGRRFKGRGPIQVTGRHNYGKLSEWAHSKGIVDSPTKFVDNPQLLSQPEYGFLGAVWYWTVARDMNSFADNRDLIGATRAVNGGQNGIDDRRVFYYRALNLGEAILPSAEEFPVSIADEVKNQLTGSPKPGEYPGWPQLGDFVEPQRTVVNALGRLLQIGNFQVAQLDTLTGKKPSIVNPEKSFDAGEYLRLIDAAAFRIEAAVKRVEDLLTPKDGK
ncbi:glycoside hydrolase family 19 protein [Rhodococcoides fascians]|uniref:glycoside hydrolase family 19 protein n=1 Tax=Rhodococcoides fascians TaxID=1828 RepID=UPI0012D2DD5E|nr:glycoside hydrolase family 19 protein [Rhodococcus fascians]